MLNLINTLIEDEYSRENFQRISDFFRVQNHLFNFKHFEVEFPGAVTGFKFRHGLGFQPKDVIQTSLIGAGSLTWNYTEFNKDTVSMTTTGACVVRFFLGTYKGAL